MKALILGTGLIGASIGAGLRELGWDVSGWDPDPRHLEAARAMGAIDRALADPPTPGEAADLLLLAGPVRAILEQVGELQATGLMTDVASVKTPVVNAVRPGARFVGGHPMAGRESSGPGAATAAMFRGATWILTTDGASEDDLDRMEEIVSALGAVPVRMTAARHDAVVAAVSHVPQVVASALVNLVAQQESALDVAAGGFRDLTRIALSEPAWWTDVLTANRQPVTNLIRQLAEELKDWADRLERQDRASTQDALEAARQTRQSLAAPVAAVRVLLEDRPGEIARVGQALAEAAVDVRDLQLRHATRGGGGVLTLSIRPGQEESLSRALVEQGFRLVE